MHGPIAERSFAVWVCTDFVDLADADAALRATYACTRQWTDESSDRAGSSAPGGGLADAPPADRLFRACELRVVRDMRPRKVCENEMEKYARRCPKNPLNNVSRSR